MAAARDSVVNADASAMPGAHAMGRPGVQSRHGIRQASPPGPVLATSSLRPDEGGDDEFSTRGEAAVRTLEPLAALFQHHGLRQFRRRCRLVVLRHRHVPQYELQDTLFPPNSNVRLPRTAWHLSTSRGTCRMFSVHGSSPPWLAFRSKRQESRYTHSDSKLAYVSLGYIQ